MCCEEKLQRNLIKLSNFQLIGNNYRKKPIYLCGNIVRICSKNQIFYYIHNITYFILYTYIVSSYTLIYCVYWIDILYFLLLFYTHYSLLTYKILFSQTFQSHTNQCIHFVLKPAGRAVIRYLKYSTTLYYLIHTIQSLRSQINIWIVE